MTDIWDQATLREELDREACLDAVRSRVPHGDSLLNCDQCGDEIAEERRRALPGVKLCIHCAELNERRARGFAMASR